MKSWKMLPVSGKSKSETTFNYSLPFTNTYLHNGMSHVEKIFKKTELLVSMGRLKSNLDKDTKKSEKKMLKND